MPFTAPSGPTQGLQPYGLIRRETPNPPRGKTAARKTRPRGRHHPNEGHMSKIDEMLDALRQAVAGAASTPESEREELLKTSFDEFKQALGEAIGEEREDAFTEGLNGNFAKFAEEQGLAKNMGHVSEMAGQLRSIELMLDRLANEADGKSPYGGQVGYPSEGQRDPEHAAALHELLEPWYGLGVRLLTVMASMEAGEELGDMDADDVAMIEEDVARLRANIGVEKADAPDHLRKFAPPQAEGEEGVEVDDNAPMDPIDTMQRLAAAMMVILDAVQNANGGGEEEGMEEEMPEGDEEAPEDEEGGEEFEEDDRPQAGEGEAPETGEEDEGAEEEEQTRRPPFGKSDEGDMKKQDMALQVAEAANEDLAAMREEMAMMKAELSRLRSQPAPAKGPARVVQKSDDGGAIGDTGLETVQQKLEKMSPEERTRALIKISQGVPLDRI